MHLTGEGRWRGANEKKKEKRDQIDPGHGHGHVASELGLGVVSPRRFDECGGGNHQEPLGTDGTGEIGLHSRSSHVADSLIAPSATLHLVYRFLPVSPSMTPSAPEIKNQPSGAADELLAIDCQELYYSFQEGLESALNGATLQLPRGGRCLLVGANGGESRREMYAVCRSQCVVWEHWN